MVEFLMYFILAMSIIGLAVIEERFIYFKLSEKTALMNKSRLRQLIEKAL